MAKEEGRDPTHAKAVAVAREYAKGLNEIERLHLYRWAEDLLKVRNSTASVMKKALAIWRATARAQVARSLAALLAAHAGDLGISVKRLAWDERGWIARFFIAGASLGALRFGRQRAGIAALGGAIGVPLWFLGAAGGAFLGAIVEECKPKTPTAKYAVIETERVDDLENDS